VTSSDWLQTAVAHATVEWHPNAARLTRALAAAAPVSGVAVDVITSLGGVPSSVMARLTRAGLPSAKQQLALFRLALALDRAIGGSTVARIAWDLGYSSPASFGRTLRHQLGLTGLEFLHRWSRDRFWTEQVGPVMQWPDDRWTVLDVLEGSRVYGRRPAFVAAHKVGV
jgi:AraC-like DNA-binding protein